MSGRHGIVDAAVQRAGLSRRQWVHLQCGTLVKPLREADTIAEMLFPALFGAKVVRLIRTTRPLWEEAARLRAETGLKTPEALHAAAALHAE